MTQESESRLFHGTSWFMSQNTSDCLEEQAIGLYVRPFERRRGKGWYVITDRLTMRVFLTQRTHLSSCDGSHSLLMDGETGCQAVNSLSLLRHSFWIYVVIRIQVRNGSHHAAVRHMLSPSGHQIHLPGITCSSDFPVRSFNCLRLRLSSFSLQANQGSCVVHDVPPNQLSLFLVVVIIVSIGL